MLDNFFGRRLPTRHRARESATSIDAIAYNRERAEKTKAPTCFVVIGAPVQFSFWLGSPLPVVIRLRKLSLI